jgi:hypothetical protein
MGAIRDRPGEITPSVDGVVGNAGARGCVEDASAVLLRILRERATSSMRSSTKAQQVAFAAAVSAIFANVASQYEAGFNRELS